MANRIQKPLLCQVLIFCVVVFLENAQFVVPKPKRPTTETEIERKKLECLGDIESGLWGEQCRASVMAKENCALQCLSPQCYALVYEIDPLEEGEKDLIRSHEFSYCLHRLLMREPFYEVFR